MSIVWDEDLIRKFNQEPEVDKRMAQDGGLYTPEAKQARLDAHSVEHIAARAYETGLQVGATLATVDILGEIHGEFCHMSREQWLAARRAMALSEAQR